MLIKSLNFKRQMDWTCLFYLALCIFWRVWWSPWRTACWAPRTAWPDPSWSDAENRTENYTSVKDKPLTCSSENRTSISRPQSHICTATSTSHINHYVRQVSRRINGFFKVI